MISLFSSLWRLLPAAKANLDPYGNHRVIMAPPVPISDSDSDEVLPIPFQTFDDIYARGSGVVAVPGSKRTSVVLPFPPRSPSDEQPTPPNSPCAYPTQEVPHQLRLPGTMVVDKNDKPAGTPRPTRESSPSVLSIEPQETSTVDIPSNPVVAEVEKPHFPDCSRQFAFKTHCSDADLQQSLPRTFFFYIATLNLASLRTVARELSVKQGSLKAVLLAKTFLRFMLEYNAGVHDVSSLLSIKRVKAFEYFTNTCTPAVLNQDMPTVAHLQAIADTRGNILPEKAHATLLLPANRVLSDMTETTRGSSRSAEHVADCENSCGSGSKRSSGVNGQSRNVRSRKGRDPVRHMSPLKGVDGNRKHHEKAAGRSTDRTLDEDLCLMLDGEKENHVEVTASERAKRPPSSPPGRSDADSDTTGRKGFTDSEFLRLLLLLRDDEDCRESFFAASQPLPRRDLDRGIRSSDFWDNTIEPAFNSSDTFACAGNSNDGGAVFAGADPTAPPPSFRSGSYLETTFKAFRAKFVERLQKYSASGQNNPDFKSFLIGGGMNENTALGRRLVMAGFVLRVGKRDADGELIHLISRTIGECGMAGYEAPLSQEDPEHYLQNGLPKTRRVRNNLSRREELHSLQVGVLRGMKDWTEQRVNGNRGNAKCSTEARLNHSDREEEGSDCRIRLEKLFLQKDETLELEMKLLQKLVIAREGVRNAGDDEWMKEKWGDKVEALSSELERFKKRVD